MFHIENRKKVLHGRSKTVPHPKSGWLKISYFSLSIQTQVWFRNDRNYMKINNIYRGMQIRPRRFDSGFGLHIRKPRRPWSTGFFYACDLADHFRNFSDRLRNLGNDLNHAACGQLDEISVVIVWDASC